MFSRLLSGLLVSAMLLGSVMRRVKTPLGSAL